MSSIWRADPTVNRDQRVAHYDGSKLRSFLWTRSFFTAIRFSLGLLHEEYVLGSFSIDDGNGSENVAFKMNSRFSKTVAFIPIWWKRQM